MNTVNISRAINLLRELVMLLWVALLVYSAFVLVLAPMHVAHGGAERKDYVGAVIGVVIWGTLLAGLQATFTQPA